VGVCCVCGENAVYVFKLQKLLTIQQGMDQESPSCIQVCITKTE